MFNIAQAKGFQLSFDNGLTVSVQFGPGNYCEKKNFRPGLSYSHDAPINAAQNPGRWESVNAEVAVFRANGSWMTREFFPDAGDDVVGYLNAGQVADLIYRVANWKKD